MADRNSFNIMNFLTEPLASSVTVDGKSYPINTDFRVWLRFYELVTGKGVDYRSIIEGMILCYKGGVIPPSFFKASEAMWDFFLGEIEKGENKSAAKGKKIFDFTQDAGLIYSSFLSDYGIDLLREDMHWHKFLTLFKNLSPDSAFMRVVAIRSINPADIKDASRRSEIVKKQRVFALRSEVNEDSIADELTKII